MSGIRVAEMSPEELADLMATREHFQRERPSLDDVLATGDYDGPYRHADVLRVMEALATLRRERQRRGLSLAVVSERSGLDEGLLDHLEHGKVLDPSFATLWRYAEAVGMSMRIEAEPAAVT